METLRHTETNAADDSSGRAFGLDGNLYLPVLLALVAALGLFSILVLVLGVPHTVAALVTGAPFAVVVAWAIFLKQGRPAGYDRDIVEYWLIGGNFTRVPAEKGRVAE